MATKYVNTDPSEDEIRMKIIRWVDLLHYDDLLPLLHLMREQMEPGKYSAQLKNEETTQMEEELRGRQIVAWLVNKFNRKYNWGPVDGELESVNAQ